MSRRPHCEENHTDQEPQISVLRVVASAHPRSPVDVRSGAPGGGFVADVPPDGFRVVSMGLPATENIDQFFGLINHPINHP